jgi:hypothetical protein
MRRFAAPFGPFLFTAALAATACGGGGSARSGGALVPGATSPPGTTATPSPSPGPTSPPVQTGARTHLVVGDGNLQANNLAVYNLPLTSASAPAFYLSVPSGDTPTSFCTDKAGDLFVVTSGQYVYVYSPPFTSATVSVNSWATRYRTVTHYGCAVDPVHGELVVGTVQAGTVEIYQPPFTSGNVEATATANTNFVGATGGLAFDSNGNLAANESYYGTSVKGYGMAYAAAPFGASSSVAPFGQSGVDNGVVFDAANDMINPSATNGLDVYPAPVTPASAAAFTVAPPANTNFWGWAAVDAASPQNLYVSLRDERNSLSGVTGIAVYSLPLTAASQPTAIVDVPNFPIQTNNRFGVATIP